MSPRVDVKTKLSEHDPLDPRDGRSRCCIGRSCAVLRKQEAKSLASFGIGQPQVLDPLRRHNAGLIRIENPRLHSELISSCPRQSSQRKAEEHRRHCRESFHSDASCLDWNFGAVSCTRATTATENPNHLI